MRTIQTGRKCIVWRSGSRVGPDSREDRPGPVTETRSVFVPGKEPVSFLISFTSGIPDCRATTYGRQNIHSHRIRGASPQVASTMTADSHTSGVDGRQGVRLLGSQTHILHPKGVEHIPQHRL